ncbi:MAG: homocysteine S-methyltransferase family protein [Calditrichota bacterium]
MSTALFIEALRREPVILAEGGVIERLKREFRQPLDDHVLHAGWVYDSARRTMLERIWRGYLEIGKTYDLPMIVLTPTWRANTERVAAAGLPNVNDVNYRGARLLLGLRDELGDYGKRVFIGGISGPRGDAYNPEEALSAADARAFHRGQLRALAGAGVDFLIACTLPAFSEALGIAHAMSETGLPYLISFIILSDGTLLDGTPLAEAITVIDAQVKPAPLAYMINCVHPSHLMEALPRQLKIAPKLLERIAGLQANTSTLCPHELDNAPAAQGEDPDRFAEGMIVVHRRFGLRVLGGCCGTDDRHIRAIAQRLANKE